MKMRAPRHPLSVMLQTAEELSGSLEGRSYDDWATFNIPRVVHRDGNLLLPGRDRLSLPHHAESRRDEL